VIRKTIPDTVDGSEYTLELSLTDLTVPSDVNVTAQDVQPRMISVQLDNLAQRSLPVIPRVTVRPDSGFALYTGIAVAPSSLIVRGPEVRVTGLDALYTLPLEITEVTQPVRRSIAIDTTGLAPVRLSRYAVEVSADVGPVTTRTLDDVPVELRVPRRTRWSATPEAVTVTLEGPTARLARITFDSISVVAAVTGSARLQTVGISVISPAGITARAAPDSVVVRRR
jgi:YbbR domain-containing protein